MDFFTCKKIINGNTEGFNDGIKVIIDLTFVIISIVVIIFAVSLAWKCNKGGEQVLMSIIAFIIPYLYLIGYFVYHKILGHPCN